MPEIWPPFADTLPPAADPEDLPSALPRTHPSILLVDDDPFMLGVQSRMLRSMGYPMIGAAEGADAARALLRSARQAVDVIVCDLNMPGTDGIAFLQQLNADHFHGSVILLSGEGSRIMHTVQKLLSGGQLVILGALEKPAGRAALRALLDCWKPPPPTPAAGAEAAVTEAELQSAVRERQWVLHYQPQVDLKTGGVIGVEALVRWNHPARGLVYPDAFIGLAEDCGLIAALTGWVLQQALEQLARWRAQGLSLKMAVNVSMKDLAAPDFAARVGALARSTGNGPQGLTLEVTESCLMSPTLVPLENLVRLRMQRFHLSIDDFGTGHSSLVQLRDVPFTELKIDRGFVHGARHNQVIRPMLEGSIGIAKRLGMLSVAEGVETEDDWRLLQEIGCDLAQGWFIARPMPHDGLQPWMERWAARQPHLVASQPES